ncbi:hypothetical protein AMAG_09078 [Allomyces macrogynus ATCC 38327]|uniref:Endonuclease/exonuclease/phosphatase domain-containing protein n=1 Tax=Allomyces macrogynus (strain ATCC 38327) TaxID=578462 RepID=A0A0L0SNT0_ALLM3|nr:hypothetical protein AMAG_09078 [Allomyces macrogynus ATCC 38327]|eukprot:KNE64020.1 hypothetical protein AMAG_09078 [Allomyces macrogynus ATCC 38327]
MAAIVQVEAAALPAMRLVHRAMLAVPPCLQNPAAAALLNQSNLPPSSPAIDQAAEPNPNASPIAADSISLTVCSWNVLAQCLIRRDMFSAETPKDALRWKPRASLLMSRVSTLNPDLLCLQEVDRVDELWDSELTIRGYQHLHRHKDAGRHGCLIAWRAATWDLVRSHKIVFDASPLTHPTAIHPKTGNIAIMVELKHRQSQKSIVVTNHHLYWVPRGSYLRLRQLYVLMDALAKFNDQDLPVITCGDFNGQPQRPEYCVLTKRALTPSQIEDLLDIPNKDEDVRQPKKSRSPTPTNNLAPIDSAALASPSESGATSADSALAPTPSLAATAANPPRTLSPDTELVAPETMVDLPPLDLVAKFDAFPRCYSAYANYRDIDPDVHAQRNDDFHEPAWTNVADTFRGCLDYILMIDPTASAATDSAAFPFRVHEILALPSDDEVGVAGLPNLVHASDHVAIMAKIEIVTPRTAHRDAVASDSSTSAGNQQEDEATG